uniref:Uncharacterized protein n=1 Tax=Oryza nivara TaxID=4536 RepID=A0A0E0H1W3_ORYNI
MTCGPGGSASRPSFFLVGLSVLLQPGGGAHAATSGRSGGVQRRGGRRLRRRRRRRRWRRSTGAARPRVPPTPPAREGGELRELRPEDGGGAERRISGGSPSAPYSGEPHAATASSLTASRFLVSRGVAEVRVAKLGHAKLLGRVPTPLSPPATWRLAPPPTSFANWALIRRVFWIFRFREEEEERWFIR